MIAVAIAFGIGVSALTALTATPALAAQHNTTAVDQSPGGVYVDGTGRTYAAWAVQMPSVAEFPPWDLLVSRTTTDGVTADSTWGTDATSGQAGLRRTALAKPDNTARPEAVGINAGGTITVVWSMCTGNGCDGNSVVIDRYSLDGTRTSRVSLMPGSSGGLIIGHVVGVLDDGSVYALDLNDDLRWWSANGSTAATVNLDPLPTDLLYPLISGIAARDGKLFITLPDGTARRISSTGTIEQSFANACPAGTRQEASAPRYTRSRVNMRGITPLPGPGGSLAIACSADNGTANITQVREYSATGVVGETSSISWKGFDGTAFYDNTFASVTSGYLDADGAAWMGGSVCSNVSGSWGCAGSTAVVRAVGSTITQFGGGGLTAVTEAIRSTGTDGVAWIDQGPVTGLDLNPLSTFSRARTITPVTVLPPTTAPTPPTVSNPTNTSVTVTTPPISAAAAGTLLNATEGPPTGYRIYGYIGASSTPFATKDTDTVNRSATFTGLTAGTRYRFKAAAFNSGGAGPSSSYSAFTVPPFVSFDAFTNRQYLDFAGRNATATEKSSWNTQLTAGTLSAVGAIDAASNFAYWQKQSPVIRLFRAYFLRLPDIGGLNYWTGKSRNGFTLDQISQAFAVSTEFTNRYGSLTNLQFVNLVYTNVLGRPGDSGGVTYWTSQLDQGKKTRGQVMVGFSESLEYRTKATAIVDTVNVFTGMLRRIPTSGEAATWAPASNPPARTALIANLLATAAYDARV